MLSRHGLVAIAALAIALGGCGEKQTATTVNNTTSVETTVTTGNDMVVNDMAGNNAAANGAVTNEATANTTQGVPTGGTCGGIAGTQCGNSADYCKKPTGQCGVADATGTCTKKPEICTEGYKPVCGCDHKTYSNACAAAAAGASVESEGICPKKG